MSWSVFAQEPAVEETAPAAAEEEKFEGPPLDYRTGDVLLPNKVATLHLGSNYRYLDPANAEKVLVTWGNPPGNDTQGAIVPTTSIRSRRRAGRCS